MVLACILAPGVIKILACCGAPGVCGAGVLWSSFESLLSPAKIS